MGFENNPITFQEQTNQKIDALQAQSDNKIVKIHETLRVHTKTINDTSVKFQLHQEKVQQSQAASEEKLIQIINNTNAEVLKQIQLVMDACTFRVLMME